MPYCHNFITMGSRAQEKGLKMKTYLITYSTMEWPQFIDFLCGDETTLGQFIQQITTEGGQLLEVRIAG